MSDNQWHCRYLNFPFMSMKGFRFIILRVTKLIYVDAAFSKLDVLTVRSYKR